MDASELVPLTAMGCAGAVGALAAVLPRGRPLLSLRARWTLAVWMGILGSASAIVAVGTAASVSSGALFLAAGALNALLLFGSRRAGIPPRPLEPLLFLSVLPGAALCFGFFSTTGPWLVERGVYAVGVGEGLPIWLLLIVLQVVSALITAGLAVGARARRARAGRWGIDKSVFQVGVVGVYGSAWTLLPGSDSDGLALALCIGGPLVAVVLERFLRHQEQGPSRADALRAESTVAVAGALLRVSKRMDLSLRTLSAELDQVGRRLPPEVDPELRRMRRRVVDTLNFASSLVQLSRDVPGPRSIASLTWIWQRLVRTLDSGTPRIVLTVPPSLGPGWLDQAGVEGACRALLQNALDAQVASDRSDPITVELREPGPVRLSPDVVGVGLDGEFGVEMIVSDRGDGLSPLARRHALDPFFTTRDGHDGLGLASVMALVRVGDAALRLRPRPDGGVAAHLWLRWERPDLRRDGADLRGLVSMSVGPVDVLVVAASDATRELFSILFGARGLLCASAPLLSVALDRAQQLRPGGVLLLLDRGSGASATLLSGWLPSGIAVAVVPVEVAVEMEAQGFSGDFVRSTIAEDAEATVSVVLACLAEKPRPTEGGVKG